MRRNDSSTESAFGEFFTFKGVRMFLREVDLKSRMAILRERMMEEIESLRAADWQTSEKQTAYVMSLVGECYGILMEAEDLICEGMEFFPTPIQKKGSDVNLTGAQLPLSCENDVVIFEESEKIFIRIPPLPHRKKADNRKKHWVANELISDVDIWCELIRRALSSNEINTEGLESRTICILNVFPHSPNIMDNDNRETSAVIDAIRTALPGETCPENTRTVIDGCPSDTLQPCTFITIQPYGKPVPDSEMTVKIWQDRFENGESGSSLLGKKSIDIQEKATAPRRLKAREMARAASTRKKKKK